MPRFRLLALLLFSLVNCPDTFAQDFLKLVIPEFKVKNVTLEEAITELHKWRIPVCFEKLSSDEQITFSITLKNASVMEILDALVSADKRYYWERFHSVTMPVPFFEIINVLPVGAKDDPENLMNTKVKFLELKNIDPFKAIRGIYHLVPELREKYRKLVPPGGVISEISPLPPPANESFISLKLSDVTVRDVLNEISLRSGGVCWIYEPSKSPPRYIWREFR